MALVLTTKYEYPIYNNVIVRVLGDEDMGCYEYQIERDGTILTTSQNEYGNPASAARDGFDWVYEEL